jgi:hypothetical protein
MTTEGKARRIIAASRMRAINAATNSQTIIRMRRSGLFMVHLPSFPF